MKLRKPPFPNVDGSALYYHIQALHRRSATETAIGVIRDSAAREIAEHGADALSEMTQYTSEWIVETLIQGAWMREYHVWEKDTKEYFEAQCGRNDRNRPIWRKIGGSHVDKVVAQCELFAATIPVEVIQLIDQARDRLNDVKHEAGLRNEHFVSWDDFDALLTAVEKFWEAIERQEEFTPPDRAPRTRA